MLYIGCKDLFYERGFKDKYIVPKKKLRPIYPNFFEHEIGNEQLFFDP